MMVVFADRLVQAGFEKIKKVNQLWNFWKPKLEFNSMLSQLVTDLEVVRSLVSQNGKKIGEIETDIKNKSDANENAHQDIEGTNSRRQFSIKMVESKL